MKKLLDLLRDFEENRLYGELSVMIEAGKVILIKKVEKIKP